MSTNPYGYNCSVCGMWVQSGVFHTCGGSPNYTFPQDSVALALGRIEALLQQILRKLEAKP